MKKQNRYLCIYSFSITFLLMLILFWHYGYAPFGGNSMASHDASVQYLDFYSYFKDVLSGKNNITYTFSKTLGGNNIGVFSYYLTSPFMLLCVFFKKTQLHAFFDVLVMLKLSTASFTFCWFLTGRFHKHFSAGNTSIKNFSMVILSVSYGLCQYSIAQSCNLMWLDGVYMLPLILLGVYTIWSAKKQHGNWQFQWPCPFFSTGTPEASTASSPGSGFFWNYAFMQHPCRFPKKY